MFKSKLLFLFVIIAVIAAAHYVFIVILNLLLYVLIADAVLIIAFLYVTRSGRVAMMANVSFVRGDKERARALFQKAIAMRTRNPLVYINYAILLIREGNKTEPSALLDIADKLNKDPFTKKNIELTYASYYWIAGEIDKAIEVLEEMRAKYEYLNHHAMTTMGYMYILKGEYDKAREASEKAVADEPTAFAAWDNLGQIAYRLNDHGKAKECFGKALEIHGELADSLYYMGLISEDEGDVEKARGYFARLKDARITALSTITAEMAGEKIVEAYGEGLI
jgi:tetratricopeptide (TPR) repeat protein